MTALSPPPALTDRGATRPLWRSLLYVPVNVTRFVDRALRSGADAVQLDLEDSIALSEKDAARAQVAGAAERISASDVDVIVRINRPLAMAVRDIEAAVCPAVCALSLPKVESADHVRLLSEAVAEAELRTGMTPGATRFILGIETPAAWMKMQDIALADPRNAAMLLGSEDFATAVGMSTAPENLLGPKQALVIAAAAAGLLPLGIVGSFANFRDKEAFRAMVRQSRAIGYRGSSCIHPDQIEILNAEFSPDAAEVEAARAVLQRFDEALSDNRGAIALNGAMIDIPMVERARAILADHDRATARRSTSND
jgi:citrate lyase subunit beta/citryl-CoA lyase